MENEDAQMIVLHDGRPVSKAFYDSIRTQVELVLPALVRGESYTLKRMCGKEFWDQLARWEQIAAGQCMAHLVVHKKLPLDFSEPTKGNSKTYKLK